MTWTPGRCTSHFEQLAAVPDVGSSPVAAGGIAHRS
jgi:hypothetical protein